MGSTEVDRPHGDSDRSATYLVKEDNEVKRSRRIEPLCW